jgi:alkanesulfonate monooxygenase SsuD/methylene tetrahydromethanopterin reductase-like flavin-dependent oxidoreductase (luciferase family)
VAETDAAARREAEPHLLWLFHTGLRWGPFSMPPGYLTERSFEGMLRAGGRQIKDMTCDDLIEQGIAIVGSPATVIEKLTNYTDRLRAGIMVTGSQWGDMPQELAAKNMELFSTQVMPHFR